MYNEGSVRCGGREVFVCHFYDESVILGDRFAIGGIAGSLLPFNSEGIDFAMTALFVVIFVEQWMEKKNRIPELIGVLAAILSLNIFGAENFVLPCMLLIICILFVSKKKLEGSVSEKCR